MQFMEYNQIDKTYTIEIKDYWKLTEGHADLYSRGRHLQDLLLNAKCVLYNDNDELIDTIPMQGDDVLRTIRASYANLLLSSDEDKHYA